MVQFNDSSNGGFIFFRDFAQRVALNDSVFHKGLQKLCHVMAEIIHFQAEFFQPVINISVTGGISFSVGFFMRDNHIGAP